MQFRQTIPTKLLWSNATNPNPTINPFSNPIPKTPTLSISSAGLASVGIVTIVSASRDFQYLVYHDQAPWLKTKTETLSFKIKTLKTRSQDQDQCFENAKAKKSEK